jgi:hypothetical protein
MVADALVSSLLISQVERQVDAQNSTFYSSLFLYENLSVTYM